MNSEDIKKLLKEGECLTLESKRAKSEVPKSVCKAIKMDKCS